jgi:transposase
MQAVMSHPDWALGFEDETWWSRLEQPNMNAWTEAGQTMKLMEKALDKTDLAPKALACYGLLVRWNNSTAEGGEKIWLRFVQGNPNSSLSEQFLAWCCGKLQAAGKKVLVLFWDHASWHKSQAVRSWIREHNGQVKKSGQGVRILKCLLPKKSPWLNPIEPMWIHGKRRVVEPDRVLSAQEVVERVCHTFDNPCEPLLLPSNYVP